MGSEHAKLDGGQEEERLVQGRNMLVRMTTPANTPLLSRFCHDQTTDPAFRNISQIILSREKLEASVILLLVVIELSPNIYYGQGNKGNGPGEIKAMKWKSYS